MNTLLQNITDNIPKKNVQSLAKKLLKKCNFKSTKDMEMLSDLALWLYIYNYSNESIQLCNLVQNIEFNGDYTFWDNIDSLYCLKARILREQGLKKEAKEIIKFVNMYREPKLYKNIVEWFTQTLDLNIQNASATSKSLAKHWRLLKLNRAICYKEAGKFPIPDRKLEIIIKDLIDILSLEK